MLRCIGQGLYVGEPDYELTFNERQGSGFVEKNNKIVHDYKQGIISNNRDALVARAFLNSINVNN